VIDTIINGDCIPILNSMEAQSVPLIIADPPYNIGKAAWDKIDDYMDWCGEWITACERVLADNGSFYMFHNDMSVIAKLMAWIEGNTQLQFKNLITWGKISPSFGNHGFVQQRLSNGTMRSYYGGFTEYILFYTFQDETGLSRIYDDRDCFLSIKEYFVNEKERAGLKTCKDVNRIIGSTLKGGGMATHYFNLDHSQWCLPTAAMYAKLQTTGYFQRPYEELRLEYEELRLEYEELRLEYEELRYTFNLTRVKTNLYGNSNIWLYEPPSDTQHPTQKPVDLIENIILHSSNEGDLVVDPFSGSGTTPVACIKTGRQYMGIDTDAGYCEIAERRIAEEQAQPELSLAAGG